MMDKENKSKKDYDRIKQFKTRVALKQLKDEYSLNQND